MSKYLQYSTAPEDKIVDDLGDWIDQYNIASCVVEALCEQWGEATYERAKDLWYRALERLPELLSETAKWLPDPVNAE